MFASAESSALWFNIWTIVGLLGAVLVVVGGLGGWRASIAKEYFSDIAAKNASDALDHYKLETQGKVADAARAASDAAKKAYAAGTTAGEAAAGLANANVEIEKQKANTAQANERAASLEQANLKMQAQIAPRRLHNATVPANLMAAAAGRTIRVESYGGDAESAILGKQFIELVKQLGATPQDNTLNNTPMGGLALAVHVFGANAPLKNALVTFINSQGIAVTTSPVPPAIMQLIGSAPQSDPDVTIFVGAKPL
jgi:hypothetical protein